MSRDLREGGVSTELALHNKKIPDLNPDLSKTKIPRVWGNLRVEIIQHFSKIHKPTKNLQNTKSVFFIVQRTLTSTMRLFFAEIQYAGVDSKFYFTKVPTPWKLMI